MIREQVNASSSDDRHEGEIFVDNVRTLVNEISHGILSLGDESEADLRDSIEQLRLLSSRERTPEAVFGILLFRKYADIAMALKNERDGKTVGFLDGYLPISMTGFMKSGSKSTVSNDVNRMHGWEALQTRIFWQRCSVVVLSFISFVVMATVDEVNYSMLEAKEAFTPECLSALSSLGQAVTGDFDMRPYQLILAIGVLAFTYSSGFLLYYLLPLNAEGDKYVPGMRLLFEKCIQPDRLETFLQSAGLCCRVNVKFLEVFLDAIFLVLSLIACLVASVQLGSGDRFYITSHSLSTGALTSSTVEYYTLSTFYQTFSHTNPVCMDSDASPPIRASVAMLYLTAFMLTVCFLHTYRAFRKEMEELSGDTMKLLSGSDSSAPPYAYASASSYSAGAGSGYSSSSRPPSPSTYIPTKAASTFSPARVPVRSASGKASGGGGGIGTSSSPSSPYINLRDSSHAAVSFSSAIGMGLGRTGSSGSDDRGFSSGGGGIAVGGRGGGDSMGSSGSLSQHSETVALTAVRDGIAAKDLSSSQHEDEEGEYTSISFGDRGAGSSQANV